MSESTVHTRVGFMLEMLEEIADANVDGQGNKRTSVVLLRTPEGEWKAMFDDREFRGVRAVTQQGEVKGDDIEKAIKKLIAQPRS